MSQVQAWVVLVAALVSVFGASLYLGMMLVLQFFLRPVFLGLRLDELSTVFAVPIVKATKFFVLMFFPLLVAPALQLWLGAADVHTNVLAWGTLIAYLFLAVWFSFAMRPVNQQLVSGDVRDRQQLHQMMSRWVTRNWARFFASLVYWMASVGYLVSANDMWKVLS
ncbi:hypothetical protein [Glutamicibacter sp.]|uniref:hypothetical protein n=1 Tax=Glutamicibacter sp. TaxID=1931995 RepID=UPI0028BECD6F|nr:hypothetical protein [Glutamicibacter sp.]